jgi:hypothetical protein
MAEPVDIRAQRAERGVDTLGLVTEIVAENVALGAHVRSLGEQLGIAQFALRGALARIAELEATSSATADPQAEASSRTPPDPAH